LPLTGAELAGYGNAAPLAEEALSHANEAVIRDRDRNPFGALLALAAGLVLPGIAHGHAEVADPAAILERADFRVCAKPARECALVEITHFRRPLSCSGHEDRPRSNPLRRGRQ